MPGLVSNSALRFVMDDGHEVTGAVREHHISDFKGVHPVRLPPSCARQPRYPGYWTQSARNHVVHESMLERDRILLADFDPKRQMDRGLTILDMQSAPRPPSQALPRPST